MAQISKPQIGAIKARTFEIGPRQHGTSERRARKVDVGEIALGEIELGQVHRGQLRGGAAGLVQKEALMREQDRIQLLLRANDATRPEQIAGRLHLWLRYPVLPRLEGYV